MHISFAMVCVGCVMTSVRCKLIPHQCEDTQLFEQGRFGMWVATAIMMCFHGPFISRTATRGLQDSKRFKIRYAVHIFFFMAHALLPCPLPKHADGFDGILIRCICAAIIIRPAVTMTSSN